MRESDIEKWLLKRLPGCLYYKFVSPGNVGVPDRIVILPGGAVIFLELKCPDGALSEAQKLQHRRLCEHRCDVRTIWTMEDAKMFAREVILRGRMATLSAPPIPADVHRPSAE